MKTIIALISRKIKNWNYLKEFRVVSFTVIAGAGLVFFYHYGESAGQWISTEKGQSSAVLFMAGMVICVVIRLYYRVMVIKYYEKDINIRMFENRLHRHGKKYMA